MIKEILCIYIIDDMGTPIFIRENYIQGSGEANHALLSDFVIDVQDTNRYGLALGYLEELIDFLKNSEHFIEISLFLHKFDPNLIKKEDFKKLYQRINTELVDRIKTIIPNKFNYNLFKTTIYTVFEKTLF